MKILEAVDLNFHSLYFLNTNTAWNNAMDCAQQALDIWKLDNAIHWINFYPADSAERSTIMYLLDSKLSVE